MEEIGLDKLNDEEKEKIIRECDPKRLESKMYHKYGIDDVWYEFMSNGNFMGINGITGINNEGVMAVGVKIAWITSDGGDLDDKEISLDEVNNIIKKLQDKMGICKPPKIITGTVAC